MSEEANSAAVSEPEMVPVSIPDELARLALMTHSGFSQLPVTEMLKLEKKFSGKRVLKKATAKSVGDLCMIVGFGFILQVEAARKKRRLCNDE